MKKTILSEKIKPLDLSKEFYTAERCYITELSNSIDDPDLSIARARVEPGVTTRWHRLLNIVERYIIIAGEADMQVGALPATKVKAGDMVLIPAMCAQRIRNTGSEDLVFWAICTPRFNHAAYEDIEDA